MRKFFVLFVVLGGIACSHNSRDLKDFSLAEMKFPALKKVCDCKNKTAAVCEGEVKIKEFDVIEDRESFFYGLAQAYRSEPDSGVIIYCDAGVGNVSHFTYMTFWPGNNSYFWEILGYCE